MKRFITRSGTVSAVHMDGYFVDERRLDRILIQVQAVPDGTFDVSFHPRDERFLAQFSAAQKAQWLEKAVHQVEWVSRFETVDGEDAWLADEIAPPSPRGPELRHLKPAKDYPESPAALAFLRRS